MVSESFSEAEIVQDGTISLHPHCNNRLTLQRLVFMMPKTHLMTQRAFAWWLPSGWRHQQILAKQQNLSRNEVTQLALVPQ